MPRFMPLKPFCSCQRENASNPEKSSARKPNRVTMNARYRHTEFDAEFIDPTDAPLGLVSTSTCSQRMIRIMSRNMKAIGSVE